MEFHETCVEYFKRRLSEGWKCVEAKDFKATLVNPEGSVRREIDLRHDIATFDPNGAGNHCGIPQQTGCAACPGHWACVDANDGAFVYKEYSSNGPWYYDVYAIPDHTTESGEISKITVFSRCSDTLGEKTSNCVERIRIGGGDYNGTNHTIPIGVAWTLRNHVWAENPADSEPWEWGDIDDLEIGVGIYGTYATDKEPQRSGPACKEVYVEVDYTPAPPPAAGHSPWAADTRPHKRVKFHQTLNLG